MGIPTKPKGDLWEIPLMMKIPSLLETIGILKIPQRIL